MSRIVVNHLVEMLDQAFEAPPNPTPTDWHSLLSNLRDVRDEDWEYVPANGKRSIAHLMIHCGFAFRMYAIHGFGDGTLAMQDAVYHGAVEKQPGIEWTREGHKILHDALAAVTDEHLADAVRTHWGEEKPRIWFARTIIEHTIYHAGEINHIRALAQGNDV